MEPFPDNAPLIVIVGVTAAGKSALALSLAERYHGEIICADSRTVYKHMDIGTAKPDTASQQRVPHHLVSVTTPDKPLNVSDFKLLAEQSIKEIISRGNLPFLVGGNGLYIDSLLFDFSFRKAAEPALRQKLESLSVDELQTVLLEAGLSLPVNSHNPRHLIRTIETAGQQSQKGSLRPNTCIIGLRTDRDVLRSRVEDRVDAMLSSGLEQEARGLYDRYGKQCPVLQTIGYQEFLPYFDGTLLFQEVRQKIIDHTMQYAKRQKSWFSRNKSIQWISKPEEAVDIVATFLNK